MNGCSVLFSTKFTFRLQWPNRILVNIRILFLLSLMHSEDPFFVICSQKVASYHGHSPNIILLFISQKGSSPTKGIMAPFLLCVYSQLLPMLNWTYLSIVCISVWEILWYIPKLFEYLVLGPYTYPYSNSLCRFVAIGVPFVCVAIKFQGGIFVPFVLCTKLCGKCINKAELLASLPWILSPSPVHSF